MTLRLTENKQSLLKSSDKTTFYFQLFDLLFSYSKLLNAIKGHNMTTAPPDQIASLISELGNLPLGVIALTIDDLREHLQQLGVAGVPKRSKDIFEKGYDARLDALSGCIRKLSPDVQANAVHFLVTALEEHRKWEHSLSQIPMVCGPLTDGIRSQLQNAKTETTPMILKTTKTNPAHPGKYHTSQDPLLLHPKANSLKN